MPRANERPRRGFLRPPTCRSSGRNSNGSSESRWSVGKHRRQKGRSHQFRPCAYLKWRERRGLEAATFGVTVLSTVHPTRRVPERALRKARVACSKAAGSVGITAPTAPEIGYHRLRVTEGG
jgi:hypothetical protein